MHTIEWIFKSIVFLFNFNWTFSACATSSSYEFQTLNRRNRVDFSFGRPENWLLSISLVICWWSSYWTITIAHINQKCNSWTLCIRMTIKMIIIENENKFTWLEPGRSFVVGILILFNSSKTKMTISFASKCN